MENKNILNNKKVMLLHLGIELTKDCNLECCHCMNGASRKVDLDEATADKIFGQVDMIEHLSLSGGEPMLADKSLAIVIAKIKEYQVPLLSWGMITNGTVYNTKTIALLKELEELCQATEPSKQPKGEVYISKDQYHLAEIQRVRDPRNPTYMLSNYIRHSQYIKKLPWYVGELELAPTLFDQGRAVNLKDAVKAELSPLKYSIALLEDAEIIVVGPRVFMSAEGIITYCNASYEDQLQKYNYGNIKERLLIDCIQGQPHQIFYSTQEMAENIKQQLAVFGDFTIIEKPTNPYQLKKTFK